MKMLKWLGAAAISVASVFSVSSSAQAEDIVFAGGEWAPYIGKELPDEGIITKHLRDYFSTVGVNVSVEYMPWKRAYETTRAGKFAATFAWSKTDERAAEVLYPQTPVMSLEDYIYYRASAFPDGLNATSLEELAASGARIAGSRSYWYEAALTDAGANVHWVNDEVSAYKLMAAGRADVRIVNEQVWASAIEKHFTPEQQAEFVRAENPLRTSDMYILFSKNHPDGQRMRDLWDQAAASQ